MSTIRPSATKPITPMRPAVAPAPALAAPAADTPHANGLRSGIADSLRAVGNGYNQAADHIGVASEKAYIYPVETAYAAATAVRKAAVKMPPVQKVAGGFFSVLGFITAFHGMIIGGVLRSPGDVVRDVTHAVADKIDGKQTLNGNVGAAVPGIDEGLQGSKLRQR